MKRLLAVMCLVMALSCGNSGPRESASSIARLLNTSARKMEDAPFVDSAFAVQTPASFVRIWRTGLVTIRTDQKSRECFLPLQDDYWIVSLQYAFIDKTLLLSRTLTNGCESVSSVLALDVRHCRVLWDTPLPNEAHPAPVLLDSAIYLVAGKRICRIDIVEGQLLWDVVP